MYLSGSIPGTPQEQRDGEVVQLINAEADLEGLIARALWESYEFTLPVSPATMARVVVAYLKDKGFMTGGTND